MCGIAGIVEPGAGVADEAMLRDMTRVLAHRGPDGEGIMCLGPVGLGHRRLAIIDLAAGHQPMASADGSAWIVFNGEIYNFRELRRELEARGHLFRTSSDTEVILAAWEAFGVDCVQHLRGMFAFGIWDGRRRCLFLARDRVGIKPLVYAWDGQRLLFASEIKAILRDPTVGRQLDWDALRDYLVYHYVPGPRTIFQTVRKLPPACSLLLDADHAEPQIRRYWDLRFAPDHRRRAADWIAELRHELEGAVTSHLVSDVPVGAFLSGGIDSSAVVALMARARREPVRTFSIGFDEADFDELAFARQVASRYETQHCEFVVKPDALEALPRLAWQFDEPFADASALPTYYVAKVTREHVTVALSGDGGDEVFAGYRRYAEALAAHDRLDGLPGVPVRALLRLAARLMPATARGQGYLARLGADPLERYWRAVTYQHAERLGRLLGVEARRHVASGAGPDAFRRLAVEGQAPDYVSTLQYVDIHTYLPDDILAKVDRTSMLTSLEARVPLLDHRLMEFVATIPTALKLREGRGKWIFKQAMADALPATVLSRGKMGFGVPLERWFRGELGRYAHDLLLAPRARQRGIFAPEAVERLLAQHAAGRDRSSQIWALLCFEEWARRWMDR